MPLVDVVATLDAGLHASRNLIAEDTTHIRRFRRRRAPIIITVLGGVVVVSAMGGLPTALRAVIGVHIVLVMRCVDAEEAWGSINDSAYEAIGVAQATG